MTLIKNIGKNTIGDNKKMEIRMHDYNMSTHDLSTIFRNTQSPGTLVPAMTLLAQKGDTFYIDIESHVLTHPTIGPLFGSFKHENHVFTIPIRLYNSWLHNNKLNIGLRMNIVKIPQLDGGGLLDVDIPTKENPWSQVNPSSLLSYLGFKGFGTPLNDLGSAELNAIPLLGYYDIFKNYYANTQEEKFYTIGTSNTIDKVTLKGEPDKVFTDLNKINTGIKNGDILMFDPANVFDGENILLHVFVSSLEKGITFKANELGRYDKGTSSLTVDFGSGTNGILMSVKSNDVLALETHDLNNIDSVREYIYTRPGNEEVNISALQITPYNEFFQRMNTNQRFKTTSSQFGLALKTYASDINQNWVNTEWIDGPTGINEISAVDVSDGTLTMDALNLAQKVYNMLNRIAVSGGTYRDWLDTVYTGGNYLERCETPIFEGGVSQEIVFQEVISNAATSTEPLGTLAGRGVTTGKQRGGKVKIKVTEPSYIMVISSITPRIDYSQGNEFYVFHKTMDDLHKPALDGIGYQDSLNWKRAWWDRLFTTLQEPPIQPAVGKTVAWIDYMTNVNKTYGNFATGMSEAFMVMNRSYELGEKPPVSSPKTMIGDLTTYIDPIKYNYIFADTNLDAMNFWVQTKFDVKVRRLISAKQIPNL